MSDTTPYPRRTVDTVIAALAGSISGVLASVILVTTLTAVTGNFTTVNTATLNATSTAAIATSTVQNATIGNLNASSTLITPSMTASSTRVGTSGTQKTGEWATSVTVDPNSIAPGQTMTTAFTLTGIAAGDRCVAVGTAGDLSMGTSTARLSVQASTDAGTISYYNSTSTASYDAGNSTIGVKCERF